MHAEQRELQLCQLLLHVLLLPALRLLARQRRALQLEPRGVGAPRRALRRDVRQREA